MQCGERVLRCHPKLVDCLHSWSGSSVDCVGAENMCQSDIVRGRFGGHHQRNSAVLLLGGNLKAIAHAMTKSAVGLCAAMRSMFPIRSSSV